MQSPMDPTPGGPSYLDACPLPGGPEERLGTCIRHELAVHPYYDVFDHVAFRVEPGGAVTLVGSVTRPSLKASVEQAVLEIEGVESIDNQIEVLSASEGDNRIRWAIFRSLYGAPGCERSALQADRSIHIIVKNGEVTIEGVVETEADKKVAALKAKDASRAAAVTNNLRVVDA